MSTDYNYDEQAHHSILKSASDTDQNLGTILPLLHPHDLRSRYPSPLIYPHKA